MRPLDPLAEISSIARLLRSAPAAEVRTEIARLDAMTLAGGQQAARDFAKGAFGLREGALDAAHQSLTQAAEAFERLGEAQASRLSFCEAQLAAVRRGPRAAYPQAVAALSAIAKDADQDLLSSVVATHYRATAERFLGDVEATQRTLLDAFRRSEPFLEERAKILNSLGTLYVLLGAFGAAQALLEHAAELHHQHGDAVGEAIACGQLGSAALALGDLERARRYLQKQEWFASRVGDSFGQARALTFLADVALELGRADDAITLAQSARSIAESVSPPLKMWTAYATRAIGRARMEMGDEGAEQELGLASELFAQIGNPLGAALTQWDEARLKAHGPGALQAGGAWFKPAWALGSLGLTSRVAQLLQEEHAHTRDGGQDRTPAQALAAVAQGLPHLAAAQEIDLVYTDPDALAGIAARRTAAQRNLGRLAALTLAPPGLWVAAIVAQDIPSSAGLPAADPSAHGRKVLPPERAAAAAIAALPAIACWVWPIETDPSTIAADLATVRASLGPGARIALDKAPRGRVLSPPFAGEVGARMQHVDWGPLLLSAGTLPADTLLVGKGIEWPAEANAVVSAAGLTVRSG